jgi:hypothetical protein
MLGLYCVFGRFATPAIRIKMGIESPRDLSHIDRVKATTKRQTKTEAELLDHATNNLLRALKQDMQKKEGRVDSDKLRKDGYSDRLITRLEQA